MGIDIKKRIDAVINSRAGIIIGEALSSRWFPFVTAALMLLFYYTGSDLLAVYYLGISGLLTFVFCDDVTPLFSVFLFMNVIVSGRDTPLSVYGWADKTAVLVQIFIVIALYLCAAVVRMVLSVKSGKFKVTPVFYGLLVFAFALFFNGAFAEEFDIRNLFFGGSLAVIFLGVFVLGCGNIKVSKDTFEKIALSLAALGILLICELFVAYVTTEGVIVDGIVIRGRLRFGWGTYNNMGMLLTLCVPAALFLAGKCRYGWLFTLYSIVLVTAAFFSMSRQSIIGACAVFAVGAVVLIINGKNRWINVGILSVVAVGLAIYCGVRWDSVISFFESVASNFGDDNGRFELYRDALINFRDFPVFGKGFYVALHISFPLEAIDYFPPMFHNTLMQIMSSCGTVGLVAYVAHRMQTIKSFCKNVTVERTFIALTVCGLLIVNLFDNYLFYMFPTMVYGMLISVLVKSENKEGGEA